MAIVRRDPLREIEHWEPFREMENLRREMDRLFDRLMPLGNGRRKIALMPAVEMDETSEEVHLKLEIPGIDAKDLDVEVTEDEVSISGERKEETQTEERGIVRSEFHYGKFERVIPLPVRIQSSKVHAEYTNGILNLTLPKIEEEKTKIVKVDVG